MGTLRITARGTAAAAFVLVIVCLPVLIVNDGGTVRLDPRAVAGIAGDLLVAVREGTLLHYQAGRTNRSLEELLPRYFLNSFLFLAPGAAAGVGLGLLCARSAFFRRGKVLRESFSLLAILPGFVLAVGLQVGAVAFYQATGLRIASISRGAASNPALLLPALTLAVLAGTHLARVMTGRVRQIAAEDYITAAASRGIDRGTIFSRHLMPGVLAAVEGDLHEFLGVLLANLFILERVFGVPGITQLIFAYGFQDVLDSGTGRSVRDYQASLVLIACLGLAALYALLYWLLLLLLRTCGWTARLKLQERRPDRRPDTGGGAGRSRFPLLLALGILLSTGCLLIAAAGPHLAPFGLDEREPFCYRGEGAGAEFLAAPHAPSARHPFGTDEWGYDVLTLLLHGARYTVFACLLIAGARLACAAVGAGVAGAGLLRRRWLLRPIPGHAAGGDAGARTFSFPGSIPSFVIIFFVLDGIAYNPPYPEAVMALVQGVLIALVGLGRPFTVLRARIAHLSQLPFVEAAQTVGASPARIMGVHVAPHLLPSLAVAFTHEILEVASLIGVLGIFHIYIGGTTATTYPVLYHSKTHEWAGLVGEYYSRLQGAGWLFWFPLGLYLLFMLSLYALSRGAELWYADRFRRGAVA